MQTEDRLAALLTEKFQEEDFADCFLIELTISASKKVEVIIDSDSGLTFKKCQRISRYLEQHLDEEGWLGEKYIMEVSSPGVDRPLKFHRQYVKNIGRQVEVKLLEDQVETGLLTAVHEESIDLEQKVRRQEGKRKKTVIETRSIPFSDIKQTKVKISFAKK